MKQKKLGRGLALLTSFVFIVVLIQTTIYAGINKTQPDKSELINTIKNAQEVKLNDYIDESVSFFNSSIKSANEIVENKDATQTQIDKHILLLNSMISSLVEKNKEGQLHNGVYTIDGILKHAISDQESMGNQAISKPMKLVVDNNSLKLNLELSPLTIKLGEVPFFGYLGYLKYYPNYTSNDVPLNQEGQLSTVEKYYDGVYDKYNHPQTALDPNMKGKLYPNVVSVPVEINTKQIWVQVYISVMETISQGSGTQYARLQLNWDSLKQISGQETNKTKLDETIKKASDLLAKVQSNNNKTFIEVLQNAIKNAESAKNNINVSQEKIDAIVVSLEKSIDLFNNDNIVTDKTKLKEVIELAKNTINQTDVTFTKDSVENLKQAISNGEEVFKNESATQTQINNAVNSINDAIKKLIVDGTDKRELKKVLDLTLTYLDKTDVYIKDDLDRLKTLYDKALAVYNDKKATQEQVDLQINALKEGINKLQTIKPADKTILNTVISKAQVYINNKDEYTQSSIDNLSKSLQKAKNVNNNQKATQEQVNNAITDLLNAITAVEKKQPTSQSLDKNNLKNGIYSIKGKMLKTDKTTLSMANEAINRTIKLEVINGQYYVDLDFKGLAINSFFGYLGKMGYYDTGYTVNSYGKLVGTIKDVKIKTYQKDENGNLIKDNYGTNYPDIVSVPVIKEAKQDGFIPLQVSVPIMNSIASGSGIQDVYLKLDWNSLQKASNNDVFVDNTPSNHQSVNIQNKKPTINIASTLPKKNAKNNIKNQSNITIGNGLVKDEVKENKTDITDNTQKETSNINNNTSTKTGDNANPLLITILVSVVFVLVGVIYKLKSKALF